MGWIPSELANQGRVRKRALPASVWVWFKVFVFISAEVGVVHMLRGERITKNPRARESVGNSSAANIATAAMRLPSEAPS